MNLSFGIREKTTLLVIVLVAAATYFAPQYIVKFAMEKYEDREIIDLADEATLRTWEIRDEIETLQRTTWKLANDKGFRQKFGEMVRSERAEGTDGKPAVNEIEQRWKSYLRVEVCNAEGDRRAELFPPTYPGPSAEEWEALLGTLRTRQSSEPFLSPIHRLNVGSEAAPHWMPVIFAGARVQGDHSAAGEPEFVRTMLSLDRPKSNRHLLLLIDEEQRFLIHPNQSDRDHFSNKPAFLAAIERRHERFPEDKPLRSSVQRMAFLKYEPQRNDPELDHPYFFISGIPNIDSKDAKQGFSDAVERNPELSDKLGDIILQLSKDYAASDCRLGGLGGQVGEIRLLATSPDLLRDLQAAVEDELAGEPLLNNPTFEFKGIEWREPVECSHCDTSFMKFGLDTTEGTREYQVLFSGFREEFAESILHTRRMIDRYLIVISLVAGIIAFFAALLFVRPLRKITRTAQSVTDTSNEALLEKVDVISRSLPVARKDEVGEIARALRRLFGEVQASTRQLDQRVRERTLELEDANEKLKGVNREKDTFLANVSHELRNPLNVVDGYLQFLESSELDDEQRGDVRKSRKAAKALLELINDILDYQKITMRGISLEPEEVDLPEFIEDIRDLMQIHAERNNNRLVFESEGDLGVIQNDGKRLRQVILNLMGNACKFTQNGVVTLNTKRVGDADADAGFVEFRVRDSGRGMAQEEQSKIFTVFYTNKKANESGTGLGLAISRELCRLMGGRISLESSVEGKGSTFLVRVPADISEETPLAKTLGRIPDGSHTVLVIDDNDSVREMMRRFLTKQGYEVIQAADGEEGVKLARSVRPDAITLDAVMPKMDGWQVLSELKSDLATASIPVVMVTILDKEAKGFALGADDYVTKPIDWEQFSNVLGNLTDRSNQRTILVVDDEGPARELFRRALSAEDCRIVEAENGLEALNILKETTPDIIILDLMMPVMDGFEFLAEYHRNEDWQSIPVVVVTAKSPTDEEREFLDGTVARVLQKGGGTTEELLATIHRRFEGLARARPAE